MNPLFVYLISLVALYFLVMFALWFYYWAPKFRFWLTFSLWPERDFEKKQIVQEQIETVLGRLVFPFLLYCTDEQKITEKYRGCLRRDERMPKKDMKRLKEIQRKLEREKRTFFKARDLARRFDHEVCDDAQGYLTGTDRVLFNVNHNITTVPREKRVK